MCGLGAMLKFTWRAPAAESQTEEIHEAPELGLVLKYQLLASCRLGSIENLEGRRKTCVTRDGTDHGHGHVHRKDFALF